MNIDFPLVFKLCATELRNSYDRYSNLGYKDDFHFFKGVSKYNESLFGWSGHQPNGSTIADVKGKSFLCVYLY